MPPYNDDFDDDWVSEDWDDDYPEGTDTRMCLNCGSEIYEEAQMCPVCGEFVLPPSHVWDGKPGWYIWLAVLGIFAVILALLAG